MREAITMWYIQLTMNTHICANIFILVETQFGPQQVILRHRCLNETKKNLEMQWQLEIVCIDHQRYWMMQQLLCFGVHPIGSVSTISSGLSASPLATNFKQYVVPGFKFVTSTLTLLSDVVSSTFLESHDWAAWTFHFSSYTCTDESSTTSTEMTV